MRKTEVISQHPRILFKYFRKFFLARIISAIGDKFFSPNDDAGGIFIHTAGAGEKCGGMP